ncbi:MAG: tetratricopeptide repeat protein, partial [Sandaracinaceae bacterium]|nr:tetratricopeptide repeat protein [Sandaracinaceae bacterium]
AELLGAWLEAAPRPHPEISAARRARAWALALAGGHRAAIDAAIEAAGLQDEPSAALLGRLAALSVRRDDLEAARRALRAAHEAFPQDDVTLRDLGAVELALGRPTLAAEHFTRVVARRPDDLDARRDLAGALVAAGMPRAAMTALAEAIARHPDEPALSLELAHAALEARAGEAAERASRDAIERLDAEDARGHAALGAALLLLGRREAAAAAYDEALRRDPSDVRARQGRDALRAPTARSSRAGRTLAAP